MSSIGLIQETKERQMTLAEQRDAHKRQALAVRERQIEHVGKELKEGRETQMKMEEKIFMLSVENKQRQEDKEGMLMLLPHILKAIQGKPNSLRQQLMQIENEGLKNKVLKLLQAYKIPGLK